MNDVVILPVQDVFSLFAGHLIGATELEKERFVQGVEALVSRTDGRKREAGVGDHLLSVRDFKAYACLRHERGGDKNSEDSEYHQKDVSFCLGLNLELSHNSSLASTASHF